MQCNKKCAREMLLCGDRPNEYFLNSNIGQVVLNYLLIGSKITITYSLH